MMGWGNPYTAQSGLSPWGGNELTGQAPPSAFGFGGGGFQPSRGTTNNYYGWGQNQTGYAPTFGGMGQQQGGALPLGTFNSMANQTVSNWANQAAANKKPLDMGRLNSFLQATEAQRANEAIGNAQFANLWGSQGTGTMLIPNPQGGLMADPLGRPNSGVFVNQAQQKPIKPVMRW